MQHLNKIIIILGLSLTLCFSSFLVNPVQAQTTAPSNTAAPVSPTCKLSDVGEENKSWVLPDCVYFEGTSQEKECGCRNINVLIQLMIKVANKVLMVVGGVALLMFIYGGFIILTAAGSSEGIKKGKQALTAAAIGLIIIFSAQMLLSFLLAKVNKAATELGGKATVEGVKVNVSETK